MSDENMNGTGEQDRELNSEIARLDWELQPEKDLWPGIRQSISQPKPVPAGVVKLEFRRWIPYATAASLLLGFAVLMLSLPNFQQMQLNQRHQAAIAHYQESHLLLIEQQHGWIRNQLQDLVERNQNQLSPTFIEEAETLMANVDRAANEIKMAISAQPNSPAYTSMLVRTYQQELKLFNRVKATPGLST